MVWSVCRQADDRLPQCIHVVWSSQRSRWQACDVNISLFDIHDLSIAAPSKSLRTSLPGKPRPAAHAPSPSGHASLVTVEKTMPIAYLKSSFAVVVPEVSNTLCTVIEFHPQPE